MKKAMILSLVSSFLLASPALASHDGGHHGERKSKEMGEHHAEKMEMMMESHKMYGERGVDLMALGNQMIAKGYKAQDAKMMLHGAEMLKTGHKMHQHAMHAMKKSHHTLKHHIMHAKVGDMKMSAAEMKEVQNKMDMLKAEMKKHHEICHPQSAMIPKSAEMLMKMGNTMVIEGRKNSNDTQAMHGMKMMKTAMRMMMPGHHGEGHHKGMRKEIRIEKEVRMSH